MPTPEQARLTLPGYGQTVEGTDTNRSIERAVNQLPFFDLTTWLRVTPASLRIWDIDIDPDNFLELVIFPWSKSLDWTSVQFSYSIPLSLDGVTGTTTLFTYLRFWTLSQVGGIYTPVRELTQSYRQYEMTAPSDNLPITLDGTFSDTMQFPATRLHRSAYQVQFGVGALAVSGTPTATLFPGDSAYLTLSESHQSTTLV